MTAIIGFAALITVTILTVGFAIYLIWLPKPPTRPRNDDYGRKP